MNSRCTSPSAVTLCHVPVPTRLTSAFSVCLKPTMMPALFGSFLATAFM
jgi:hypothetical protein